MKKILLGLGLLISGTFGAKAQGLEGFVAEKFYVTVAADQAPGLSTALPVGSVVWRFYADLAPGWELQSVYGDPNHTLHITTTTAFFNNTDRGAEFGNGIGASFIDDNNVYIDSYLSLGATCANRSGVLKVDDDNVNNIAFTAPYLQNNPGGSMGLPLTQRDGSTSATTTPPAITPAGIATELGLFATSPTVGNSFTTTSGAWATTQSAQGTVGNRVLIAQITSDGILTYAFNIQVRNTSTFAVENYVPSSPVGAEIVLPALTGTLNAPNPLPVVAITAPAGGSAYLTGQPVTIDATATDTPPGTITNVEFLVNGVVVGSDNSAPYQFVWTSTVGNKTLTARATDDLGGQTTSAGVNITVGNVVPPTCVITAPASGATFVEGDNVNISVNATDDGTVSQVEFFVDGLSIGVDNSGPAPFTFVWPSVEGNYTLTAVATDNNAATTTSAPVSISVFDSSSAYRIVSSVNSCANNNFCLPIEALSPVNDVIGYDIVLEYDVTKVTPTGVITVGSDLITPTITSTANSIDNANGLMYISVFFNASAPANAEFNGTGELLCVQFARLAGFLANDTADFQVNSLQESYFNGVQPKIVTPGDYVTFQEGEFNSTLKFWFDNSPIKYDALNPATYLVTDIKGSTVACTPLSATAVQPDLNGDFTYDYSNGPYININKDIPNATSVQPVVNGFDAFFTRRLLINDISFVPSIYQMIAMDVNTDGVVSSGDLSQINQRAVLIIGEYRQDWNYTPAGTPIPGAGPSKDWLFIPGSVLSVDSAYMMSSTFPFDDGLGYSKARVPQIDFCLEVPIQVSASCSVFDIEEYKGILLGDVNGNFATNTVGGPFRMASDKVVFDLTKAVAGNGYIDVPVTVMASDAVNAVDFALSFNESKMSFGSVNGAAASMETLANYNTEDKALRFTSYSLESYDLTNAVATVRFSTQATSINQSDLSNLEGFINGDKVGVEVIGNRIANEGVLVNVFPNPASTSFNIVVSEDASMQLMDVNGRLIAENQNITAYQNYVINTETLAKGVYMLKVYNSNIVSMKKVVIE